jgi:protein TonB
MFRFEEGSQASGGQRRPRLQLVPEPPPRLFQLREQRRPWALPLSLAVLLHAAVIDWAIELAKPRPKPAPAPVPVVFRKPPPPKLEPAGGGGRPPPKAKRRRIHVPVPPPKLEEPPPVPEEPEPEPPALDDVGEEDGVEGGTGLGSGTGTGTGTGSGTGSGTGPGTGGPSKARKAWLESVEWRCDRPGMEDLGRIVVRIRVEVRTDGKPGEVTVIKPGPEPFNRRAIDCAKAERYLPELDREGHPVPAVIEFGIDFRL